MEMEAQGVGVTLWERNLPPRDGSDEALDGLLFDSDEKTGLGWYRAPTKERFGTSEFVRICGANFQFNLGIRNFVWLV